MGFQLNLYWHKNDKNFLPLWAKSCIVILGNHEDKVWSKSDCFALVLFGDSLYFLLILAIGNCWPLCQGDCKNAFCQVILPLEEITIVCPPSDDSEADQKLWLLICTHYSLQQSPFIGIISQCYPSIHWSQSSSQGPLLLLGTHLGSE